MFDSFIIFHKKSDKRSIFIACCGYCNKI